MATDKEVLGERQKAILDRVDYMRRVLANIKSDQNRRMLEEKIVQLLDEYNELQRQIDQDE